MEKISEDWEGKEVYGTGHQKTPEERARLLREQEEQEHAYALKLSSTKAIPTPDEWQKESEENKVIQFPKKKAA